MFEKKRQDSTEKAPNGFNDVEVHPAEGLYDEVFGEITDKGPNYRAVGAVGSYILMTKANLGLGVLSIPFVFQILGIVPGILLILFIQTIIIYCAATIGSFKIRHPEVYGLGDAGFVFAGRLGREFFYGLFWINMILVHSGAVVGISTALNAVSAHGACTAVFMAVAAIMGLVFGSIRTLGNITWLGWAGLVSLLVSVITLTVAAGVQDRPAAAPVDWVKEIKVFGHPTFAQAMGAVSAIIFSYGATPTYFNIVSEMRDPRKYVGAMTASVCTLTVIYLILGGVVYHYCGQYVASPALGSAGPLMKKVCYGLAIPALLASLTIFAHLSGKHLFVRIMKRSKHLTSNSATHWTVWLSCIFGSSVIGYIIASAIPNFGVIISLIGALVVPVAALLPYNLMWWHDNWRFKPSSERTTGDVVSLALNIFIFGVGLFITGAGTYGAVMDLIAASTKNGPWTCADNSNSVPDS